MASRSVIIVMLVLLSAFSLAASDDLVFQAVLSPRQAKLFQHRDYGYSVELVAIRQDVRGSTAQFFINGKELTPPLGKGDEHKTLDGSTLEVTLVKPEQDTAKFLFFATGNDPLPMPDEQDYVARTIAPQYNYTDTEDTDAKSPARDADAALPRATAPPPVEEPSPETEEQQEVPEEPAIRNQTEPAVEEKEIVIEGESETFSIGWLNRLWDWISGVFS